MRSSPLPRVRRHATRLLALAGALGAVATSACGGEEHAIPAAAADGRSPRPNIVLLITDDQDIPSLRRMPNVQRGLAERGTTYDEYFATYPLCCPSRTSVLTGQMAHNHGITGNKPPEGCYERLRTTRPLLPEQLQRSGYRTGFIGKYLNGYGNRGNEPTEIPRGWDAFKANAGGGYFDFRMNENGEIRRYGSNEREYQTDVLFDQAEGFAGRSATAERPFFLMLSTQAPHTESGIGDRALRPAPRHEGRFGDTPLPRTPSFNEADVSDKPAAVQAKNRKDPRKMTHEYRDRLRSLLAVDDGVGRLIRTLRRAGELDDTVFIYTSDNGYLFGQHRMFGKSKAGTLYEDAIRLPLLIRGPGIPRGERRSELTANVDLTPTILDLAGAEPPRELDGRSLVSTFASERAGVRRDLLIEDLETSALRTKRWFYAEHRGGERELYDLARDPHQLDNRAGDERHRLLERRLAARLGEVRDCRGEACP